MKTSEQASELYGQEHIGIEQKIISNPQKGCLVLLMNARIRFYLKYCLPPLLIHLVARRRGVSWSGNFDTWQNALAASSGYDSPVILEKVKHASLKVKQGLAAYERDSVAFSKKEYRWPVLAILLKIAAQKGNQLRVLDVGGSLGSSYFQHRDLLDHVSEVHWNIVEQESFVACGKTCFETEELRFFEDLESCFAQNSIQIALLSGVLQYVESPYDLLGKVFSYQVPYIIIDRAPFLLKGNGDRLTVQKVPASIYPASYPAWFFNQDKFVRFVEQQYRIVTIFDTEDEANIACEFKGLFLEKLDIGT